MTGGYLLWSTARLATESEHETQSYKSVRLVHVVREEQPSTNRHHRQQEQQPPLFKQDHLHHHRRPSIVGRPSEREELPSSPLLSPANLEQPAIQEETILFNLRYAILQQDLQHPPAVYEGVPPQRKPLPPRILIVSMYHGGATALRPLTMDNKKQYASRQGYDFIDPTTDPALQELFVPTGDGGADKYSGEEMMFAKFRIVRHYLGEGYDWVLWMDADAM
jgi:hypothetical protein